MSAERGACPVTISTKSLVDGIFLDIRREAAHDGKHPPGKQAVGFMVRRQDDQPRTHSTHFHAAGTSPLDTDHLLAA